MITKHVLIQDFPEFEEKINTMKVENNHFKKLFNEFDELEHEIYRVESDAEPASDEALNDLRIKRVHLKDEIYQFLSNN